MAEHKRVAIEVRAHRERLGMSQAELAVRAGLSRSEVSAVETGRVSPSITVALALAGALERPVEEIFQLEPRSLQPPWAWSPRPTDSRYWVAEAPAGRLRFPVETTAAGVLSHDGPEVEGAGRGPAAPGRTLVLAGCDPAVSLLVDPLLKRGVRLLPLVRASRRALELLRDGLVHVAGVHLHEEPHANLKAAEEILGRGCRLVHVAHWEEGVAIAPGSGVATISEVLTSRSLRWVVREEGSGARRALDLLFAGFAPDPRRFRRVAHDHRGVAEMIRSGAAQAGVCVRLAAEDAGLDFLPLRREAYDLCFTREESEDPRISALLEVVRSGAFRAAIGGIPGYDPASAGETV